jgi:hypothetical protein
MTKVRHLFTGLTVALASRLAAGSSYAQNVHSWLSKPKSAVSLVAIVIALSAAFWPATRALAANSGSATTWVSGTGNDAYTSSFCQRAAPCKTFTAALSVTLDGGVISCADPVSDYGPLVISSSVTIDCTGSGAAFAVLGGQNGIIINTAGIFVVLRGLTINSSDVAVGAAGVSVGDGAIVQIEQCKFSAFNANAAIAVNYIPSSGNGQLTINDSSFFHNGTGSTGGGIVIRPQGTATARVILNRVLVTGGVFGIAADGTNSTNGINMTIADSVAGGNSLDGIVAVTDSGHAPIGVMVNNTKSSNNGFGIRSIGPNVTVRVSNSTVIGNGTGLSSVSGGALLTFGNNEVRANGADGAFSGSVALQ